MSSLRASGTSTSGTANTVVCSLAASAGKELIGWTAMAGVAAGVQNGVQVKVTYSDASFRAWSTDVAIGGGMVYVNAGGSEYWDSVQQAHGANFAKQATLLEVLTNGTLTGSRWGILAAEEV